MQFGSDIRFLLRLKCEAISESLTFHLASSSGQMFNLSCTLLYKISFIDPCGGHAANNKNCLGASKTNSMVKCAQSITVPKHGLTHCVLFGLKMSHHLLLVLVCLLLLLCGSDHVC